MSQPYLFYSERCPNSKQIIETLKALNKSGLYKFILVESLQRNQIPSFLTKVPTLYIPDTKEVVVGKDIYGYIAKPTNARKELPTKAETIATGGASAATPGEYSPWGFEGAGTIGESYSLWDTPTQFSSQGGSMYTFLDAASSAGSQSTPAPTSENTLDKSGSNSEIAARLEAIQKQRDSEFGGVQRK